MAKHKYKVLFFIAGSVATAEDETEMDAFGARCIVCIRNASMIGDNDAIEDFDAVAGLVPARYAAEAANKPELMDAERPTTSLASLPEGSALAPVVEPDAVVVEPDTAEAEAAALAAADADTAKPKPPAPKPEAAKGWKPNA